MPAPIYQPGPLLPDEEHTWVIHGEAYDMRAFVSRHPGGVHLINLGAGRDCTAMFESYHALSHSPPHLLLAKYRVDRPDVVAKLAQFQWAAKDPFYMDLKQSVRAYLDKHKTSHKASPTRWFIFTLAMLIQCIPIYWWIQGYWISLIILPLFLWVFSVNYFHDASHSALSHRPWLNTLIAYLYPYFESPTTWAHQHVVGHHAYTNCDELDPDVMDRFKSRKKIWRLSFLYWPLFTFMGCFIFDAIFFLKTRAYKRKVPMAHWVRTVMSYVTHMSGRALCFYCMHVLPFKWFPFWKALAFAAIPIGIFGTCFGLFTQLSHMTLETYGNRKANPQSWAAHQVLTTQNIATDSFWAFVFSGALNLQIEHHLFPSMCSEHFPSIAPIVKDCCHRHNIPYQESPNYWVGFCRHLDLLQICTESGFFG
jgi:fatty acid desaturase